MTLHIITTWTLGLLHNYVVLILGNCPHNLQGCYTQGMWIGLRELVVLTLNIQQIFN